MGPEAGDGYRTTVTTRLDLRADKLSDVDDVHAPHADPRVWWHFPQGRHHDRLQTQQFVQDVRQDWTAAGLGYWAVRPRGGGPSGMAQSALSAQGPAVGLIGVAGVGRRRGSLWNVYYRFTPGAQGRGYAQGGRCGRQGCGSRGRRVPAR